MDGLFGVQDAALVVRRATSGNVGGRATQKVQSMGSSCMREREGALLLRALCLSPSLSLPPPSSFSPLSLSSAATVGECDLQEQ